MAGASMSKSFERQIDKTLGVDFMVQNSNFMPFNQEVTDKVGRAAAQLLTTGRRRILRLSAHWPWTNEITAALARLTLL